MGFRSLSMKKVVLLTIAALSFFASGCDEGTGSASHLQTAKGGVNYGGVFKINEVDDFRSFYPHDITDVVSWRIASQVYQGLVRLNAGNLKVMPCIAERYETNHDATKFTFFLRKNVYFHDDPCFPGKKGRRLTADDFMYCFTRLCEPHTNNQVYSMFGGKVKGAAAYYESVKNGEPLPGGVEGIKVIDPFTLEIELEKPFGSFLRILATTGGFVFPQEAVAMYGDGLRTHAVGTGAFRLKTVKEGEVVILERNPNYWEADMFGNKLPYIYGVKTTFLKDKKMELEAFRNNNIHLVYKLPVESIQDVLTTFDQASAGGNPPFQIQTSPSMLVQYYGFLHAEGIFNDIRVRKAFNYAVNRDEIVDHILRGEGIAAKYGVVPPSFSNYPSATINSFQYDPDKAAGLLAEAGFPNGKGFPALTLQLNSGGLLNEQVAIALQSMLRKNLNIEIKFNMLPINRHYERIETGKAEFWRGGWSADYPDPENFLNMFYGKHIPANLEDRAYLNSFRYRSAKFDSVFALANSLSNEDERMKMLAKADQVAIDDAAVMPLYYDEVTRLLHNSVRNCPVNALELRDFSAVWFVEGP